MTATWGEGFLWGMLVGGVLGILIFAGILSLVGDDDSEPGGDDDSEPKNEPPAPAPTDEEAQRIADDFDIPVTFKPEPKKEPGAEPPEDVEKVKKG